MAEDLNRDYRDCYEQAIIGRVEDWADGPLDYNYTDILENILSESMIMNICSSAHILDFHELILSFFLK